MSEKGYMLTQFEECFGHVLEHEAIKSFLQSCDWDPVSTVEAITAVVDMTNIPENVFTKIYTLKKLAKVGDSLANCKQNQPQIASHFTSTSLCEPSMQENKFLLKNKFVNNTTDLSNDNGVCSSDMSANNIWQHAKHLKYYNNNLKSKVTNNVQNKLVTNEHESYNHFFSDSHFRKHSYPALANENAVGEKSQCLVEVIHAMIASATYVMVIMRGLPGSGKTTLAKVIAGNCGVVLSADDHFLVNGHYKFDRTQLSSAHDWNKQRAKECLVKKKNPIVIDNTNLQMWEMKPYVFMAFDFGYKVEFLEPDTSWRYNARELSYKTRHGVPKQKIEEMLSRFERNVCIKDFNYVPRLSSNVAFSPIPSKITNCLESSSGIGIQSQVMQLNSEVCIGQTDVSNNIIQSKPAKYDYSNVNNIIHNNDLKETVRSYISDLQSDYLVSSRESSPIESDTIKFDDIVQCLQTEVRKHINKSLNADIEDKNDTFEDTFEEDKKMYEFCMDIEDKHGDSISSFLRQQLSKELQLENKSPGISAANSANLPTDSPNRSIKVLKVPALDTVVEELTKDFSSKIQEPLGNNDDDTSDDASSEEFLTDDKDNKQNTVLSASSWDCLNVASISDWDTQNVKKEQKLCVDEVLGPRQHAKKENSDINFNGVILDLNKKNFSVPTSEEVPWDANFESWDSENYNTNLSLLRKTGAVPKHSKVKLKQVKDNSQVISCASISLAAPDSCILNLPHTADAGIQTNLDETLKNGFYPVKYGNSKNYVLGLTSTHSNEGPITRGILLLDKGTMTDEQNNVKGNVEDLHTFFPAVSEFELKDILANCSGDVDWAMNILLDGGYKIEDSADMVSESPGRTVSPASSDSSSTSSPSSTLKPKKSRKPEKSTSALEKSVTFPDKMDNLVNDMVPSSSDDSTEAKDVEITQADNVSDDYLKESKSWDDVQFVSMELDNLFAYQLINIFGPVGNLNFNHSFKKEEMRVCLPISLCQEIHKYWNSSIEADTKKDDCLMNKYINADAAYAQQLQEQEGRSDINTPFFSGFDCKEPPTNLREIMNLEKAIQQTSKRETCKGLSSQLMEIRLCQEFSHVDPTVVKEIFQQCKGSYDEATTSLLFKFGILSENNSKPSIKEDKLSTLECAIKDTDQIQQETEQLKSTMDKAYDEQDNLSDPQRWDWEYDLFHGLRKSMLEKARLATGPNRHVIAAHYGREAARYASAMYEAQVCSTRQVFQQRNAGSDANTIDLHMLTVPAAVTTCLNFVQERQRALNASGTDRRLMLNIITGWGRHSTDGKSRIKPAVKNILTKNGYLALEMPENRGVIKVPLSS